MNAPSIQLNAPLSFNQLLDLVKQLSIQDKLRLESMIWYETDENDIEILPVQKQLVSERLYQMNQNSQNVKSWEDIERNLKLS